MTSVTAPGKAASTEAMRAEADQLRASVRDDNRSLLERSRKAAQLAWEADLIDDAAMALVELNGARSRLPQLEEAVRDATAAERTAEDRLRLDERHLARRRAEQQKAETEYATIETQEQAADRVRTSERVVAAGRTVAGNARVDRERAQAALGEWEAYVAELDSEHAEAARKAANPGPAPRRPGLVPGVSKVSDMDPETRQLVGLVALLGSQAASSHLLNAAGNSRPAVTCGDLAAQDSSGFRLVRQGPGVVAIPPDWRGIGNR